MRISKHVSNYLSSSDLKKSGPILIVVDSVEEEDVGNNVKPVLRGKDTRHVIALNPTNISQLMEIFGSEETDDWVGEMVVAYNDPKVVFNNKPVGGIRFRKPKPGAVKPTFPDKPAGASESSEEDIPF